MLKLTQMRVKTQHFISRESSIFHINQINSQITNHRINEVEKSAEAHQVDEFLQLTDESIFHITIISLINLHEQQVSYINQHFMILTDFVEDSKVGKTSCCHLILHRTLYSSCKPSPPHLYRFLTLLHLSSLSSFFLEDANNPEEINFADGE